MTGEPPIDFVIITSIDSELAALLQALPVEARPISAPTSASSSYECRITTALAEGGPATYRVVVLQVGMGRVNAAIATNDAIRHWHPHSILLIGIAGGIQGAGIKLGDVVIGSQIIDYELQKLTEAGPQPRWEVFRTDTVLLEAARRTARGKWANQIKIKPPRRTKISCHFGPIASGDKIIASSDQIDILRHWPKLIGADMEGAGVAAAVAKASPAPGFLMIRGVSDLMDEKKRALILENGATMP